MAKKPHARILCVAQQHDALKAMVYLLLTEKYRVYGAQNLIKALEIFQSENDLEMLVMDLHHMPRNESEILLESTRTKYGNIPVLLVFSQETGTSGAGKFALNNSVEISYPFKPSLFLAEVESGLNGRYA